ncbi:hypothetical protein Tco_0827379 [Tanacetum coccineum]
MRDLIKEEFNTQLPQILPQVVSDFANPVIEKNVTESVEVVVLIRYSSQPMSTYKAVVSLSEFELTKILIDKMEKNKSYDKADYKKKLYDALVESYNIDKDLFDSYGEVFSLKRNSRSKEKKSSSTSIDASQSQHKAFSKSAHTEELSHIVEDSCMQQDQEFIMGNNDEQPELEYHFEECSKATTEHLDWHNPKNKLYPFDLRKPLPLIQDHRGHQIIPHDYFINNNLEYLTGGDLSRQHSTSMTKTKAATYDLKWIEDLVPKLWSLVDGMLHDVQSALNDIAKGIRMEYLPKRKWSDLDK